MDWNVTLAFARGPLFQAALAVQPDGRILLSGERDGAFVVARMLANGALDPSFGVAGIAGGPQGTANSLALQPDGRIVAAGSGFTVVRYATNGLLDKTFGVGGVATPPVAVGPNGEGKTNLLEGICYLFTLASPRISASVPSKGSVK